MKGSIWFVMVKMVFLLMVDFTKKPKMFLMLSHYEIGKHVTIVTVMSHNDFILFTYCDKT